MFIASLKPRFDPNSPTFYVEVIDEGYHVWTKTKFYATLFKTREDAIIAAHKCVPGVGVETLNIVEV